MTRIHGFFLSRQTVVITVSWRFPPQKVLLHDRNSSAVQPVPRRKCLPISHTGLSAVANFCLPNALHVLAALKFQTRS